MMSNYLCDWKNQYFYTEEELTILRRHTIVGLHLEKFLSNSIRWKHFYRTPGYAYKHFLLQGITDEEATLLALYGNVVRKLSDNAHIYTRIADGNLVKSYFHYKNILIETI